MGELMTGVCIGVVVLAGVFWGANKLNEKSCQETAAAMGVRYTYNVWVPCLVEVNGRMMPLKSLRALDPDDN